MKTIVFLTALLLSACVEESPEDDTADAAHVTATSDGATIVRRVRDDARKIGEGLCAGALGCYPETPPRSIPDCTVEYVASVCYTFDCEAPSYMDAAKVEACSAEQAAFYPSCDDQIAPSCGGLDYGPPVPNP